ncbi:hypothetical protein RHGRI_025988 [Rhododendron griersonianum]|uniref:Transposase MuDR plant domain-containing protein n=1 Tax=Rhododendron griersonianum TaxID=479676 RepID=A0AAV6IR61_9ERIC|nr:hypothetical protein RHGRI_025988 [Rhododendron griersonianum]
MARNSDKPLGGHFTIQIHHGGKFFNRPTIRYEGGCVDSCEKCIPDVMSLITVGEIVGALGYTGMINYYYMMTGKNIKNGLRMLLTDSDIIEMIKQLPPSRTVDMYIEPINPIELMESQSDEGGPTPTPTDKGSPTQTQKGCPTQTDKGTRTDKDCPTETDKGSKSDKGGPSQTGKGSRSNKGGRSQTDKGSKSDKGGPSQTGKGCRSDKGGPSHDVNYEDFLVDDAFFEDGFCDGTTYDGVDVQDLGYRSSESDASFEVDSDYEQSDDDGLYEANVDVEAEWAGFDNSKGKQPDLNEDLDDDDDGKDYGDDSSDDLHSACSNSDDDRKKDKFHEYRRETDLGKVQFTVGMKFPSAKEFREAVREYSIKEGKDIKFVKNETTRVKAKCATEECGWSVMASLSQKGESFQVKSHKSEHDCLRTFKVRHVTSMYLAEKYVDSIRSNPDMPLDHLQQRVRKDLVVDISHTQAYRAKRKALNLIEGTNLEQFAKLRDYCEELRRTNPNTTIIMKTIPSPTPDGQPIFERLYVCLGALKQGMLAGCRRLVCMDACHLKGAHGGQLLVVVGINANNQSFPFAYAVAESETKDTWTWFLELVVQDLEIQNTSAWTFMTDKQKETNANIYKGIIYPINGWTMWPSSGCVPVLPPNYGRPSGRPKKSRRKEREELENPDADKLKRQNTSLRCGKCGQWRHNIRSCKNEVNPDIRRRPSGGLVFSRPTGKLRGRPRQGGSQASSSRGRGVVAAPTEGGQALRGMGDAGRGRGGGGRGRGMTDGGRGRGRGRTDGGRGRGDGGRGRGFGSTSQSPPAQTSQAPAQY